MSIIGGRQGFSTPIVGANFLISANSAKRPDGRKRPPDRPLINILDKICQL